MCGGVLVWWVSVPGGARDPPGKKLGCWLLAPHAQQDQLLFTDCTEAPANG